ncbi:DUF805 domain-containing protein [Pseudomonas sp. CCI3.2]|uniref:DUF805 domain-containing protein n=1 Tax=unclassified Pseudomonas TaxID=196821 RepID=UPI002AC8FD03|nr:MULTISPECIES: DUF805 domain-containing protein [unclassified Pseudomonas]MEB0077353.1 DUF805 domain-containing protein [Pseudomonas sp. MH10out]MEB0092865.1 DUF805 domain-containing protein [Pseudomonas sp. CCI4.2]MEB0104301.1 DUF805 domain-containing protein [Pseudomonas sp. CCI3.2]MEB0120531.1 DUF805 domain-containing protein [Pseudomonas sp. CCI1.2]MEB0129956.1 DUF805 domain-containing protein [Pseudomonas sp. CCI2.4]
MSMVRCHGCNKEIHTSALACPNCGAQQANPYSIGTANLEISAADRKRGFFDWYLDCLKQYAVFSGRATRQEYWMFILVNIIISIAVMVVARFLHAPLLATLYDLALFIPGLAIAVRRLHDTDRSGWWILLPFVNIVFLALAGHPENNRFGPGRKMVA